jgi:hypothetical protein
MKPYASMLSPLSLDDHLAEPAPAIATWLTGQSSYRHSQLSPAQAQVLDDLQSLGYRGLKAGFPYNRACLRIAYAKEPLLAASLRNGWQFLECLSSRAFAVEIARHLQPLIDAAGRRLLLLCGSCGLQLLAAALPHLVLPPALRVELIAIGPVCLSVPRHPCLHLVVIRGSRDWISRCGSWLEADLRPPVGHLGYTQHPEARRAIREAALAFVTA